MVILDKVTKIIKDTRMDFKINFTPTKQYYKEAYSEIVKTNRMKRLEPFFAIGIILFSIGLWYYDRNKVLGWFPMIFGMLGAFELTKIYRSEQKWLNDRVKSGMIGQEIQFHFTKDLIFHTGPWTNGSIQWED